MIRDRGCFLICTDGYDRAGIVKQLGIVVDVFLSGRVEENGNRKHNILFKCLRIGHLFLLSYHHWVDPRGGRQFSWNGALTLYFAEICYHESHLRQSSQCLMI